MQFYMIKGHKESILNAELFTLSKEARKYIGFSDEVFLNKFTLECSLAISKGVLSNIYKQNEEIFIYPNDIRGMLKKYCYLKSEEIMLRNVERFLLENKAVMLLF